MSGSSAVHPPVPPEARVGESSVEPATIYRERITRSQEDAERLTGEFDRLSNYRTAAFVGMLGCGFAGVYWPHEPAAGAAWLAAGLAGGVAFVWFLGKHAGVHRDRERAEGRRQINLQGAARLARDWSQLPPARVPASVANDPVALDLDLFGQGSLFQLLGTVGTPQGRRALAETLMPPAGAKRSPAGIPARQEAVAELAEALDLRQELQLGGREFAAGKATGGQAVPEEDPLLSWAVSEPCLSPHPRLVFATRILPVLIVLAGVGALAVDARGIFALAALWIARYLLVLRTGARVRRSLDAVGDNERNLRAYGHLFGLVAKWRPRSPELRRWVERLQGADAAMNELEGLVTLAAIRTTPINPLVQWLLLWDYHALFLMERWQHRHGGQVPGWFEALGEVEALAALGTLKFDHPDWPSATFTDEPVIAARALGHPLLSEASRVANDVTLGPPGTFLLVTGSNMSGKSTLLRTVGVNVVLAQAGAPVCAAELRLPGAGVVLATSLRAQDSLQEGVSFFMAELRRLAAVVQVADSLPDEPGSPVVLYLLDEVLRGTNTEERQLIVARVVCHLLERRAVGAISTHDLSLAEVEALVPSARTVHFREEFEEGAGGAIMRFDYRMRPGLATTTNALKLLKMIGLKL